MAIVTDAVQLDGVALVRLESERLRVDVAPSVGGRIVSLVEKQSGYEFLWRNREVPLKRLPSGSEYDPNFFGGIDELLPNDPPETIDGIQCPDHGELWTTPLEWKADDERLRLRGKLPFFDLLYEREITLREQGDCLELAYRISNPTPHLRHFLWKLHAALGVAPGDVIDCPARKAQVVDLEYSRHKTLTPFDWPVIEDQNVSLVPAPDGTVDFFYLFDLTSGRVAWRRPREGLEFSYEFDKAVFPYVWLFASYGGFYRHYTVVLEPCTTMPMCVNEAATKGQRSRLEPGATLTTRVRLRANRLPTS